MKGIVAEVSGKDTIILAQDGSFRKIKTSVFMTVGSEIDLNQPTCKVKTTKLMAKITTIAAAVLFSLGIGYGGYSYTVPYSYVDVDINPSIEFTVNAYDIIIKAEALNDDGKKLLNNNSLKNARLKTGILQMINTAVEQGYIKTAIVNNNINGPDKETDNQAAELNKEVNKCKPVIGNAVLLTVSSSDGAKSEELKKELTDEVIIELNKLSAKSEVFAGQATIQQREDARNFGVTPGKFVLIEDAMEGEPEELFEELKEAAIKELIKKAKDKKSSEDKQEFDREKEEDSDNASSSSQSTSQSTSQSMSQSMNKENVVAQAEKGTKQNEDSSKEQLPEKSERLQSKGKNSKYNKDNKNSMPSNSNSNRQFAEDILNSEKQQRQKLKDELLEQAQKGKQNRKESQAAKIQQGDEEKEGFKFGKDKGNINTTLKGKKRK